MSPRRRHPAHTARSVTAGLSTAAAFGIVAAIAAAEAPAADEPVPDTTVEVRVGPDADETTVDAAVTAWLAGNDSGPDAEVIEVERIPEDAGADTSTTAS